MKYSCETGNTHLSAAQVSGQSLYLQILEDLELIKRTNNGETQSASVEMLQLLNNEKKGQSSQPLSCQQTTVATALTGGKTQKSRDRIQGLSTAGVRVHLKGKKL